MPLYMDVSHSYNRANGTIISNQLIPNDITFDMLYKNNVLRGIAVSYAISFMFKQQFYVRK